MEDALGCQYESISRNISEVFEGLIGQVDILQLALSNNINLTLTYYEGLLTDLNMEAQH